jgi:hypothetical protein
LRSYIEAMGGTLDIRAIFPDGEIVLEHFLKGNKRRNPREHLYLT